MPRSKGRTGRPWRRACDRIRRLRLPCHLCGQPIQYDTPHKPDCTGPRCPGCNPWGFTVDHIDAVSTLPDNDPRLRDPHYLRPAHRTCNSSRGTRTLDELDHTTKQTPTSGAW